MEAKQIKKLIEPLKWLIGTWKSVTATASYPTMPSPVNYTEVLSFKELGQPRLGYNLSTQHAETKAYMHMEAGHLHIGENNMVTLITAQNMGVCTIEEGEIGPQKMNLFAIKIAQSGYGTKKPTGIERCYWINNDGQLVFKMRLQTAAIPMTDHLEAIYIREP